MPQPPVPGIDPQVQALCDGFRRDYAAVQAEIGKAIVLELKAIGYRYVSLDLLGYRTGSLNEGLLLRPA